MDRELSRKHGAILYFRPQGRKTGVFVLADLESTVSESVSWCCLKMIEEWMQSYLLLLQLKCLHLFLLQRCISSIIDTSND